MGYPGEQGWPLLCRLSRAFASPISFLPCPFPSDLSRTPVLRFELHRLLLSLKTKLISHGGMYYYVSFSLLKYFPIYLLKERRKKKNTIRLFNKWALIKGIINVIHPPSGQICNLSFSKGLDVLMCRALEQWPLIPSVPVRRKKHLMLVPRALTPLGISALESP